MKKMGVKEEFLERRKKVQPGFKIHLEYEYLLNTDIEWILNEIREEIREEIKRRKKEKKIFALTLDVEKIETGNSIDMIVFLGTIVAPQLLELYGARIVDIIVNEAFDRLRRKGISRKKRVNIHNGSIEMIRGRPGGEFEIIRAEGEDIFIEE